MRVRLDRGGYRMTRCSKTRGEERFEAFFDGSRVRCRGHGSGWFFGCGADDDAVTVRGLIDGDDDGGLAHFFADAGDGGLGGWAREIANAHGLDLSQGAQAR